MKAISYSAYGSADVLEYGERPDPTVGPDSVLVKVRAAAVNPVDWKAREGYLRKALDAVFPVIPGWDVSGVVVQPGVAVDEFAVGDEVIGYVREDFLSRGTFAQYVAAPVRTLARKPLSLSFEEAAGLPLAGLTAYQVLHRTLKIREGDAVLVHAAARRGRIARRPDRPAHRLPGRRHREPPQPRPPAQPRRGTGGVRRGPRRTPAGAGPRRLRRLLRHGRRRRSAGLRRHPRPGRLRLASVADEEVFSYGGRYAFVRPDAHDLAKVAELAERGIVTVHVDRVFPLEEAAEAYRLNQEGRTRGKIVVTVDWDD